MQVASSNRVQLIISAKSSGPGRLASQMAGLPREETQERFTQALDSAAAEVFEMMVGAPLGPSDQATLPRVADYTAMIGLAGDLCGVLSFRCSHDSAAQIAGKMLGTDEARLGGVHPRCPGRDLQYGGRVLQSPTFGYRHPMHALGAHRRQRQGLRTVPPRGWPAHPSFQKLRGSTGLDDARPSRRLIGASAHRAIGSFWIFD